MVEVAGLEATTDRSPKHRRLFGELTMKPINLLSAHRIGAVVAQEYVAPWIILGNATQSRSAGKIVHCSVKNCNAPTHFDRSSCHRRLASLSDCRKRKNQIVHTE